MTTPRVEELAVTALREWLMRTLPASVDAVNLTRAASITAPLPGPYVIPAGVLGSGYLAMATSRGGSTALYGPITTGTRSATQVATDLNAGLTGTRMQASVDALDRLVLSSLDPPVASAPNTPSVIRIGPDTDCPGINAVLGLGNDTFVVRSPIIAPASTNVMDGWPTQAPDFRGQGFLVIFGGRRSKPVDPDVRRDEYAVVVDCAVLQQSPRGEGHKNREHISAALRAIRTSIFGTDGGRQLGRTKVGDIMKVVQGDAQIAAKPFSFGSSESVNPLFDLATLQFGVRTFERQLP